MRPRETLQRVRGIVARARAKRLHAPLYPALVSLGGECDRILRRPVALLAAPDLRRTAAGGMDVAATPRHPASGT
jgi:hypothetical protein